MNVLNYLLRESRDSFTARSKGMPYGLHPAKRGNAESAYAPFQSVTPRAIPWRHPIGGRLVVGVQKGGETPFWSMGSRGAMKCSRAALEAAGFQGAGTPFRLCRCMLRHAGSMGARGEAKSPRSWQVSGGAGTLHLTGDATASRCLRCEASP